MWRKWPILIAITLVLSSCGRDVTLKDCFLPEEAKTNEVIITYKTNDHKLPIEKWVNSITNEGKLTSISLNANGHQEQRYKQRITEDGVLLEELVYFYYDSLGNQSEVRPNILSPVMYPFNAKVDNKEAYRFKISWREPSDSLKVATFTRDRFFVGFTTYEVDGKEIDASEFKIDELYELRGDDGGYWEARRSGKEIYAKGLGLVYSSKGETNGVQRIVEWQEISKN